MERNIDFAEARLLAALDQVDRVAESEFTFPDGPQALRLIADKLKRHLAEIASLRTEGIEDGGIIAAECHRALEAVDNVLPILGLILRSTNIRNAFEIYGPIRHLAQTFIRSEHGSTVAPALIWSSGWDYVPMTFRRIKYLPGFIIITIPSSEAANPLLVPLAGHELGHRVWTDEKLEPVSLDPIIMGAAEFVRTNYKQSKLNIPRAKRKTTELLGEYLKENSRQIPSWNPMLLNATRQAEELFCDLIGYFLFGESFLHAFAYLLSPRPPRERRASYPAMRARTGLLADAKEKFAIKISTAYTIPPNFAALFVDEERELDFWTRVADHAAMAAGTRLIDSVIDFTSRANWQALPQLSTNQREQIKQECFAWGVPAANAGSLGNILNAAWDAQLDKDFWADFQPMLLQDKGKRAEFKAAALREIVLKSIEVFEYELIQKAHGLT